MTLRITILLLLSALVAQAQLPPMPDGLVIGDTNDVPVTNQTVTLAWNPSPDPTVEGYNFYAWGWGNTNAYKVGLATNSITVSIPLFSGTFTDAVFGVTCYNVTGESSSMTTITFSGFAQVTSFFYQSSPDLVNWTNVPILTFTNLPPNNRQFFRGGIGFNRWRVALP